MFCFVCGTKVVNQSSFQFFFWIEETKRTPFTIVCDEAHLYLPVKEETDAVELRAVESFERIAKEEGNQDAAHEFVEQGLESRQHAQIFEQAAKRFHALAMVERFHANRYLKALDKVRQVS